MSTTDTPNEHEITIRWSDLETALLMLAAPSKQKHIQSTIQELQQDYLDEGPQRAIYCLLMMMHWLMSDGITVRWEDLETAWRMVAAPERQPDILDTVHVLQTLQQTYPREATLKLISATMWITGSSEKSRSESG